MTQVAERLITAREFALLPEPRVWVVRPALKPVTVHLPGGDAHTLSGSDAPSSDDAGFAVEGFRLALNELFAD
jgi:hypothetical protein